jgi:hypothetical protein
MSIRYRVKRRSIFYLGLVLCVVGGLGCAIERAIVETPGPPYVLRDIRLIYQYGYWNVVLYGSESMPYRAFKVGEPLRLVADLHNTVNKTEENPLVPKNEIIEKIVTSMPPQHPQPFTRVEIFLRRDVPYKITQLMGYIWVRLETPPHLTEPASKILNIDSVIMGNESRFFILANGSLSNFNVFHLYDPPRVVCDFMGVRSAEIPNVWSIEGAMVKELRVAQYADKVRVIFELIPKKGLPYQIIPGDDRLEVSFTLGSGFPPSR